MIVVVISERAVAGYYTFGEIISPHEASNEAEGERQMNANSDDQINAIKPGVEWEYNALRAEVLKRIELRQQIMAITLTFAGAFLGVGLTTASVALIYPPLATFLAFGWAQNDFRIWEIATYVRDHLESTIPGLGWETFIQQTRPETKLSALRRLVVLSHGGTFLFTQLMAIGIGLSKFTSTHVEWVLLGIDFVFALLVVRLLMQASRSRSTPELPN